MIYGACANVFKKIEAVTTKDTLRRNNFIVLKLFGEERAKEISVSIMSI